MLAVGASGVGAVRRAVRSILIFDDDERVTNAIARSLGPNRMVHRAHDLETALVLARRFTPDLVIVDLNLGDVSGIEVIRILKPELPDATVALISGYLSTDITVAAVKAGADVVMSKPISGKDLLRRVIDDVREAKAGTETPSLAQVEAEHIARVLHDCAGNISEAARRLGIYRSSLQRKLRKNDPRME
jgi:two-component system, response regulator RegA